MSIDQSHLDSHSLPLGRFLKRSHRTRPEQLVGLGIFLILTFGLEILSSLSSSVFGIFYAITLALSMWTLWRSFSLRVLKIELSVFFAQFLLQTIWFFSFFVFEQVLLALVALLLLWCNTLLATMLFWKKERLSGILLLYPIVWIFFLVGVKMFTCMSNP